MKTIHYLFILSVLLVISCKTETKIEKSLTVGNVSISPEKLQAGKTATINYLGNDSLTESIYYYMVENKPYPVDINFSEEKTASINIPDSATALAFQFKKVKGFDNNNKQGYLIPLHNSQGNIIPGSKASLANFSSSYQGSNQGIKADTDSLLAQLKTDMDKHPEIKNTWYSTYLSLKHKQDKTSGKKLIDQHIETIIKKQNATEDEYNEVIRLCYNIRNTALADSITKIAATKFPDSDLAKRQDAMVFFKEKDPEKQLKIFEESGHTFSKQYKDFALNTIVRQLAKKRDFNNFSKYASQISNKQSLAGVYNNLAWDLVQKDENLEFAEKISKQTIDIINAQEKVLESKPSYLTENQYKNSLRGNYIMYADTYAWILFKRGKVKEAIKYQDEITQELAIGKNDPQNLKQRLIEFLVADKQFAKAREKAELFIRNGDSNDKMIPFYKEAYINNNGSNDGFDSQLASLQKEAEAIVLNKYKTEMLNEEAPDFKLKNLEGKEVALADLKDKVVILDFWATWCGPCKASFPGMQTAVNKYKDNPNVVFLFIDTRERGTPEEILKNAQSFIEKNKYTFNVLLDIKTDADSNDFETVTNYEVGGIPTKIVIGTDGKVKFRSVGFGGNAEKLVNELDIMIQLAKA